MRVCARLCCRQPRNRIVRAQAQRRQNMSAELVSGGSRPNYATSPKFSAWEHLLRSSASAAGVEMSNLFIGDPALSEEKIESVRSKMWGSAFRKAREKAEEDVWKDVEWGPVENALKKEYNPATDTWGADQPVEVLMGATAVDKGSIRECFRCKLRPQDSATRTEGWHHGSKNHFAKRFLPGRGMAEEACFDDVKLQQVSKYYADEFNKWLPPKKIDFLHCFIIQMHERPGKPLYFMEKFVDSGTFEKHNSNSGFVNDEHQRNTPQAFSHFTFEMSEGNLMVVDIQGVDDLYTGEQNQPVLSELLPLLAGPAVSLAHSLLSHDHRSGSPFRLWAIWRYGPQYPRHGSIFPHLSPPPTSPQSCLFVPLPAAAGKPPSKIPPHDFFRHQA